MPGKILIVDDSATVREQLRECIEEGGHSVTEAENGAIGLRKATDDSFDLLMVDVNMPVMGGLDMVESLRKIPEKAKIPVFILTTESSKDLVSRGKKCGVTAWIVKPFKKEFLMQGVTMILKNAA